MRVMCKPGSVGGLGGQPPRSTRPGLRDTIVPGPARRFSVPQAAISRQLLWHRAPLDVPTSCRGFGMGLTRLDRAAARVSEAMMTSGTPSHGIWGAESESESCRPHCRLLVEGS